MFIDTIVFFNAYIFIYDCAVGLNTYTLCELLSTFLLCQVILCPVSDVFVDMFLTFDCLTFDARECII